MHLALDIDKTITAAPGMFADMARAVRANGGKVTVLHGVKANKVRPADLQAAKAALLTCGFTSDLYDALQCVPQPVARNKAAWSAENGVDLLIDNRKKNIGRAARKGVRAAHFQ